MKSNWKDLNYLGLREFINGVDMILYDRMKDMDYLCLMRGNWKNLI